MALMDPHNSLGDNFLTCCKCLELFDNEKRAPKLLKCLHTYCEQCLKTLMTKKLTVTCLICKTVEPITPENLPNNPLVAECLQKLKQPQSMVPCDNCLKKAVAFCQDWDMNVCKTCIDKHRLLNISELKEVQKLQDSLKKNELPDNYRHRSKRSKILNLFRSSCRKTASPLKCRRGINRRSRRLGSTSSGILEPNAKYRNKLTELLVDQCKERTQSIQNVIPAIAKSIDEVDQDCCKKEDDIDHLFQSLSDKLEEQRGIAKQKVRQMFDAKKGVLIDQKSKMENLYAESASATRFAEHLCRYSEPNQHLDLLQQVNDRLKEVMESSSQVENVQNFSKAGLREKLDPTFISMSPFCYSKQLAINKRIADSDSDSGALEQLD